MVTSQPCLEHTNNVHIPLYIVYVLPSTCKNDKCLLSNNGSLPAMFRRCQFSLEIVVNLATNPNSSYNWLYK